MLPKPSSRKGRHSTRAVGTEAELKTQADFAKHGLHLGLVKQTQDGFERPDLVGEGMLVENKVTKLPASLEKHLAQAQRYNDSIYQGALREVVVLRDGHAARVYLDLEVFLEIAGGKNG